ncbi:bifunctional oligoRNAse and pAp phosphatase [Gracilibacillus halophilus YIM-C55.5]|uniref:Bifunctional oligoRNAse and pAp phosphatase n=1 Tax=Gracilibacillus halophilus YIM-C55.5 TaxID=1308866 RepID=N4W9I9_9BACI|nr:bifunctional oligoribonuclease/PAP phosphatase NrnA [Gracilibacillus halophilus]ENH96948.1 bifunctional oligoRNAse and pAp phosphatase [Gracilibacillus halophilus YIM-C55.5]
MKQTIIDTIKHYDKIAIHRHVRPDPDAYGSQKGLATIIQSSFPNKEVVVVGEEDPSLAFLATMDQVSDHFYENTLAIICDTANQDRISDQRFRHAQSIIKIDHHPVVDSYGEIEWVDTKASSTSEMIYELFLAGEEQGLRCTDAAAALLYAGIVGDTGRFLFPSATDKTFRYASELVRYSFDRSYLYDEMYKTSVNIARLKGYILSNITISPAGVSYVKLTKDVMEEFDVTAKETSAVVGVFGDIEGINAWVMFVEEDDVIRVRMRSKGPEIHQVAAKFEGGGHPLAAGAKIHVWEQVSDVLAELEKTCQQQS